jgi:hypothetical protein
VLGRSGHPADTSANIRVSRKLMVKPSTLTTSSEHAEQRNIGQPEAGAMQEHNNKHTVPAHHCTEMGACDQTSWQYTHKHCTIAVCVQGCYRCCLTHKMHNAFTADVLYHSYLTHNGAQHQLPNIKHQALCRQAGTHAYTCLEAFTLRHWKLSSRHTPAGWLGQAGGGGHPHQS